MLFTIKCTCRDKSHRVHGHTTSCPEHWGICPVIIWAFDTLLTPSTWSNPPGSVSFFPQNPPCQSFLKHVQSAFPWPVWRPAYVIAAAQEQNRPCVFVRGQNAAVRVTSYLTWLCEGGPEKVNNLWLMWIKQSIVVLFNLPLPLKQLIDSVFTSLICV